MEASTWSVEAREQVAHLSLVPPVRAYDGPGRHLKRTLDIAIVSVAIPVLLPFAILITLAILVSSRGSPVFRHERLGQGGRSFKCLKFRTMYPDAEGRLEADELLYRRYVDNDFKLDAHEDPRIFAFGRFLRKTSLDELPQLINVLLGQMSLVGPRPIVPRELASYGRWTYAYLALRPGITGPWQASGRNHIRYPERAALDADYLERWSLKSDVAILLRTVPSVLRSHGCR